MVASLQLTHHRSPWARPTSRASSAPDRSSRSHFSLRSLLAALLGQSRTVVSPLERLKILFQVQSVGREEYKMSVPKALAKMWREEGWRGFMAGNGTNCIRIVPYSAVQFSAYNLYKRVSHFHSFCISVLGKRIAFWGLWKEGGVLDGLEMGALKG
jgi:hypothetical protein